MCFWVHVRGFCLQLPLGSFRLKWCACSWVGSCVDWCPWDESVWFCSMSSVHFSFNLWAETEQCSADVLWAGPNFGSGRLGSRCLSVRPRHLVQIRHLPSGKLAYSGPYATWAGTGVRGPTATRECSLHSSSRRVHCTDPLMDLARVSSPMLVLVSGCLPAVLAGGVCLAE